MVAKNDRELIEEVLRDKFDSEYEWWMELDEDDFENEKDLFALDLVDGTRKSQINLLNALEKELEEELSTFESLEQDRKEMYPEIERGED